MSSPPEPAMSDPDAPPHQTYWTAVGAPDPRGPNGGPGSVPDDEFARLLGIIDRFAHPGDLENLDPARPSTGDDAPHRAACLWLLARARDLTFEQALEAFRVVPEQSRFAGRVLTHPMADVETWREIAAISPSRNIRFAVASIPDAMLDPGVRDLLLDNLIEVIDNEHRPLIYRVLSFADSSELRRQFKRIIDLDHEFAIQLLERDEFQMRSRLEPESVAPLLTHKDREVRTRVIMLLSEVRGVDGAPDPDEDLPLPDRTFEGGRISRSRQLTAEHLEGDQYVVTSRGYEYFVTVGGRTLCYCTDEVYHPDKFCKHVTAAMREARDERLIDRLIDRESGRGR